MLLPTQTLTFDSWLLSQLLPCCAPLSAPWASVPPIAAASVPLCGAWHSYLAAGGGVVNTVLYF